MNRIMRKLSLLMALTFVGSCASIKNIKVPLDKPEKDARIFHLSWIKNLDPVYNTGNLPIGTSSPFIFEDLVYMGDMSGMMRAYDVETGRVVWEHNEKQPIQAQANKVGDYIVYGSKYGRLFARHYLTGKLIYSTDLGTPIESQAVFTKGRLVLHLRNHTIICLDASTGKVFWRYRRSVPYSTTLQRVSKVMPYKNQLIVGFADGNIVSLSLLEGVLDWEQRISTGVKFVDVDVNPFYFGRYVVAGSAAGPMRFINPQNGVIEKTIELHQSHTPILHGGDLIVGSVHGDLYRINKFGKVVFKKKVSKDSISAITTWKNGFVVSTMGSTVHYLDPKTFETQTTFELGSDQSAVFGEIVLNDGAMGIYSSRNRLYLFK